MSLESIRHRRASAGFTLIELMVAMLVSAIVILGVYAFSSIQQATAVGHQRHVRVQQALEGSMDSMAHDLRQAGLGFARRCTELRVFDADSGQLANPGGAAHPSLAMRDPLTGEAYWVLRDGLQAHWNSRGATDWTGLHARSSDLDSAADSVDVILAEARYLGSADAFVLSEPVGTTEGELIVRTSAQLSNLDPAHLAAVQQLFVPGTFVVIARSLGPHGASVHPASQGPCALLQLTGDVQPDPSHENGWRLPIDGTVSGFDADVTTLMDFGVPGEGSVIAMGRLRWSRYELDYSIATQPYLVRHDLIGHREGIDPEDLGSGPDYPHCAAGQCLAPQLHLPGSEVQAPVIAVGPMIEDLQVAVACDGYSAAAAVLAGLPPPDVGFEEAVPNTQLDEGTDAEREVDEWLGNARQEQWAPDCVFYGSAEQHAEGWAEVEGNSDPPPAFRMSPQAIRVTLVGAPLTEDAGGGLASPTVQAVEDRPPLTSAVGRRTRFTLTEVFVPPNLRWRDPAVP